ncbi:MAG: class I SAM-dependent methyltransferase [Coxiellaceae bacterium]|nr:MAG: class I SAM-dependent methyltransferase [Coxiellaceae bacterium]
MANRTIVMNNQLYNYLIQHSVRETPLLAELRQTTAQRFPNTAEMQISPEQGQFLAFLAELIGAKRALEVGTYTGYSSLCVASILPADGQLVACDINAEWTDLAREFWQRAGVEQKIDLQLRPALMTLNDLLAAGAANSFDFAFIDADKNNYSAYYEATLKLLRPGGLIVIDNVFQDGRVAMPEHQEPNVLSLRALNEKLYQDERISISMVPMSDGITLVRKL